MKTTIFLISLLVSSSSALLGEDAPVSFSKDVVPILRGNCQGCHRPGKTKGGLDLTSYTSIAKGGKEDPGFVAGAPAESRIIHEVSGEEPSMPKDGDPLTPVEISVLQRWIAQGAKDDTSSTPPAHHLTGPPIYRHLPAVTALAWSPSGDTLAVAGYHEVILHDPNDGRVTGRLVGESPRIEALVYSKDGQLLGVAGGSASEFGEIELWNPATQQLVRSIHASNDAVFGLSFSPDHSQVAVGCADKTVRAFSVADGKERMTCNNHIDWVFGTAFNQDGTRLVTVSRDKAVKLIDVATGRLIDDVNKPRESLLSLARHPSEDLVVSGGENGELRLYKMMPRGGRLSEGDDKENSFVREFNRLPGPVSTIDFSPDGQLVAAGCATGDLRVYKVADGKQLAGVAVLKTAIFTARFDPSGKLIAVGGADGKVHLVDGTTLQPVREFDGVPLADSLAAGAGK